MSEEDSEITISLTQVKDRFDQSAETLTAARAKLDQITKAAEEKGQATEELKNASSEIASFASAAREAVDSLDTAQESVVASFESLKQLVEESDLKAVKEGVERISERLDKVTELEVELLKTKDELSDVTGRFERLKGSVGARALKKAGLE